MAEEENARSRMYGFLKPKLEPEPSASKMPKTLTRAQRTAEYRLKLKESNPDKFRAQQLKDKERSKQYRASMNDDQRRQSNEKAKIRMREYRKRKGTQKLNKCVTRRERERQREVWRKQKNSQKSMWSPMQKEAHLQKRRDRYRRKVEVITKSKEKEHRRKNRCHLPEDAKDFNDKIERIVTSASPKKRAIMKNSGLINTPSTRRKHMINERIVTNVKRRIYFLKLDKSKEAKTELRLITKSVNTGDNSGYPHSRLVKAGIC